MANRQASRYWVFTLENMNVRAAYGRRRDVHQRIEWADFGDRFFVERNPAWLDKDRRGAEMGRWGLIAA
jgi:hypothetical protein